MATFANQDCTNYFRLCRVVIDLGSDVLRSTLIGQVHPNSVKNKIRNCPELDRRSAALRPNQWACINNASITGSYREFDITLLCQILRLLSVNKLRSTLALHIAPTDISVAVQNCPALTTNAGTKLSADELNAVQSAALFKTYERCKDDLLWKLYEHLCPIPYTHVHPTRSWGNPNMPDPIHTTLGDDIERIRIIRNTVYGHIPTTKISEQDFNNKWDCLEDIMTRMDQRLPGGFYRRELDDIKIACMDETAEKWYNYEMKKLADGEKAIQKEVQNLSHDVTGIITVITELKVEEENIQKDIGDIRDTVKLNESKLHSELITSTKKLQSNIEELKKDHGNECIQTKQSFKEIKNRLESMKEDSIHSLTVLEKNVNQQLSLEISTRCKQTEERLDEKIKTTEEQLETKILESAKEITLDKLLSWKKDDETFCSTKATEFIYIKAANERKVIVTGLPGAGKSANIHHIALRFKAEGRNVCFVKRFSDMIENINKFGNEKQVYVFDDVFGVHGVVEDKRQQWCEYENKDDVDQCLMNENVTILCSSRLQVINDDKISKIRSLFGVINISHGENALSIDERVQIFKKHAIVKQRDDLLTQEITQKIANINCAVGCFPLVCRLYVWDREPKPSIEEYFNKPMSVIADLLENLRIEQPLGYFCILLCLIYDNHLPVNLIEVEKEKEETKIIREELLELCRLPSYISREEIRYKLDSLLKTFVKKEEGTYLFMHDIIHDSVIRHVSSLSSTFHRVILRHCSSKFFRYCVRLSTADPKDSKYFLSIKPEIYHSWGERVIQFIRDGISMSNRLYEDIADSCCDKNDRRLWDNQWLDVFNYNSCVNSVEEDRVLGESLSKNTPSDIADMMCALGYRIPAYLTQDIKPRHTALHWAVWYGHKHIVTQTMEAISQTSPQDVNLIDRLLRLACCVQKQTTLQKVDYIENLLCTASDGEQYNADMMQILIMNGVCVNKHDTWGYTPLLLSLYNNDDQTFKLLLNRGADVNKCGKHGTSPLCWAVCKNDFKRTELLVTHGAKVNQTDKEGMSPLYLAVVKGHDSLSNLLKSNGAVYIYNGKRYSHRAEIPDLTLHSIVNDNNRERMKELIKNEMDVNKCDNDGWSPLYRSVHNKDQETAELLLKHGSYVNQCTADGWSPLYESVYNKDYQTAKLLINHGADVNQSTADGWSPLYESVYNKDYQTAELLINHGADVNQSTADGWSPLYRSAHYNDHQMAKLLINHGVDVNNTTECGWSSLCISANNKDYQTAELLLNHGANVNQCNNEGWSPFYISVYNKDHQTAELYNKDHQTAELFLNHGADVNQSHKNDVPALYQSVLNKDYQTADLLINHGANVNRCNKKGCSPLYISQLKEYESLSHLLISHGALCICDWREYTDITQIKSK